MLISSNINAFNAILNAILNAIFNEIFNNILIKYIMIKTKKIKLSINRRSNKTRLNKRRSNKTRLNKRRSNKRSLNKRRSNKRRSNKRQKGGNNMFRSNILPVDVINTGRGISHASGSLMNNLKGISVSPSPYPTLDHPIDNPVSLA